MVKNETNSKRHAYIMKNSTNQRKKN